MFTRSRGGTSAHIEAAAVDQLGIHQIWWKVPDVISKYVTFCSNRVNAEVDKSAQSPTEGIMTYIETSEACNASGIEDNLCVLT